MGGSSILFHLGGASLGNNLASQLESQEVDPRNKFQQFTKQTEKHLSLKSKISIKEVVVSVFFMLCLIIHGQEGMIFTINTMEIGTNIAALLP